MSILVPLFPLDELVVLPGIATDLHVFELRYRELLRSALRGDHRIAMAVHDRQRGIDSEGVPAIHPHVCIGTITAHQALPDGRSLIRLEGQSIGTVADEDRSRSFRVARLDARPAWCEDPQATALRLAELWAEVPDPTAFGGLGLSGPATLTELDHGAYRCAAALPLDTPVRLRAAALADIDRRVEFLAAAHRRYQRPPNPSLN